MLIIYKTAKHPTRLTPVGYKIKSLFLFLFHIFSTILCILQPIKLPRTIIK